MSEVIWRPSEKYIERANVTRFMRAHGIETYEELVARSQEDVEWFWDAVVKDLGIGFFRPYERVLDTSDGFLRRGQQVAMGEVASAAADRAPSVQTLITWSRLGLAEGPSRTGR